MDSRDVALQSVMPTVMVPRFSELEELDTPGNRILMAENGIWLEVCRAWLYMRTRIAIPTSVPFPYGVVRPELRFRFGKLPKDLVTQFIEQARKRCPNECAAWVVWNERTTEWRLLMLEERSAGPGHVSVNLPSLGEDEHRVIDLHSHGWLDAFFSSTDDYDDGRGETKIAGVIGNLDQPEATASFRLCANGMFVPLQSPRGQEGSK